MLRIIRMELTLDLPNSPAKLVLRSEDRGDDEFAIFELPDGHKVAEVCLEDYLLGDGSQQSRDEADLAEKIVRACFTQRMTPRRREQLEAEVVGRLENILNAF